jgi:hypothetical protein
MMLLASDLKQLVSFASKRSGAPKDSIKGASPAAPHSRKVIQEQQQQQQQQQQQHAGDKFMNEPDTSTT